MRTWLPLSMIGIVLAGPTVGPAVAQGVPTFDLRLFAAGQAILEQTDRDLALQQDRLTREEELAEIERRQLASLEGLMDAMSLGSGDVAGTVAGLETGQGAVGDVESAAASLYAPEDNNPAAARMFGDPNSATNIGSLLLLFVMVFLAEGFVAATPLIVQGISGNLMVAASLRGLVNTSNVQGRARIGALTTGEAIGRGAVQAPAVVRTAATTASAQVVRMAERAKRLAK